MKPIFALALLLCSTASASAPDWIYCRAINHNLIYEVHKPFISPDKKYAALTTVGDGEYVRLSLYRWDALRNQVKGKCLFSYDLAAGFTWRPGAGHELLYGLGGDRMPAKAGVFSWNGREKCLLRGHGNRWLALTAVSKSGDSILYELWPDVMDQRINKGEPFIKKLML